ncbi:MAG: hypothetical protein V3T48_10530 [Vicinamibacterales bacterium]
MIVKLIILVAVIDALVGVVALWAVVRFGWKPFAQRFPPRRKDPDAVERRFQSFRLGFLSFGFCIHVAADQGHLHLQPAAILRFFGAPTASIPWSSIQIQKHSRTGKSITARINERTLLGPAWCLGLAEPTATGTTGRHPATAGDDATAGASR